MMEVFVNSILTGIFSVIFLWQAWSTISKYQAEKTTLHVGFDKCKHLDTTYVSKEM